MKQFYTILGAILVLVLPGISNAQNIFPATGSTGMGTLAPDASSMLEIKSTTKGILIPRMTKTQRDAIAAPATGLMIYQTNNTPGFYYYDGGAWKQITSVGVNKSLSNLTGPTEVNVDLLPGTTATLNLGSSSFTWNDAYFNGSIFMGGSKFISRPGTYNTFIGELSGVSDSTGFANTATGAASLRYNGTGNYNTANGYATLQFNTTGVENSAFGSAALTSNTTGNFNTGVGSQALSVNTNGSSNTSIGAYSLYINSTGFNNTASGTSALYSNTGGYHNTANGSSALHSNTTGDYNSAVGAYALFSNTTGVENTAIGRRAMYFNKTANYNTAVGNDALYHNAGAYNTATGHSSLFSNTDGSSNTVNGYEAMYKNTTASNSTAMGYQALYSNTTGLSNTAMGAQALYYNTTGERNTGFGLSTLGYNTTGSYNAAGGTYALWSNTSGGENTAFGFNAGSSNDANNYCSFFGYDADQSVSTNFTNSMALGNSARITASNQVRIGNSNITSIGGYADWSNISDGRFKKNLKQDVPGLAFINKLKPVTYNLDISGLRKFIGEDVSENNETHQKQQIAPDEKTRQEIDKKEKQVQTGFVAQDVEKAAKELGYDFSGVDKPGNENSPYGLRYSEFVVPLVKAVQELSKMNDDKDALIQKQNNKIDDLENRLAKIEATINMQQPMQNNKLQTINLSSASLEQNIPNPFNHSTTINYSLPQTFTNGQIIISDKTGKTIKAINVSGSGKRSLQVEASSLIGGTYQYSLYENGKLIATKQMLLVK